VIDIFGNGSSGPVPFTDSSLMWFLNSSRAVILYFSYQPLAAGAAVENAQ
jgi:hypothetical protein